MPSVEDCVEGMEHISMHKMNLLHSDQNSRRLQLNLHPIGVPLDLHSEDQTEEVFQER